MHSDGQGRLATASEHIRLDLKQKKSFSVQCFVTALNGGSTGGGSVTKAQRTEAQRTEDEHYRTYV